ncbi:MAG: 4-hydroxythreonine-4-phosphate dehydrogenase PdxA, partial [Cyclobacteriaceae bacterium]
MNQENKHKKPIIGITIGDINGIGAEVIIKTLSDNRITKLFSPVIYGSSKIISYYRKALNAEQFNYNQIKQLDQLNHRKINVLNCWEENVTIQVGSITSEGGKYAYLSLKAATDDLLQGSIDAMVTAPINKKN